MVRRQLERIVTKYHPDIASRLKHVSAVHYHQMNQHCVTPTLG